MKNWPIIIIAVLPGLSLMATVQDKEPEYQFIQNDNSYSFRARFIVNVDSSCLINVIYEFEHIRNYAAGANSLELVQLGENWYDVTYTYRRLLVFENQSTWRRTLKGNQGRVVFEMISIAKP